MEILEQKAARNVADIVSLAIRRTPTQKIVVVFDVRTPLARLVTTAYRAAVPDAAFVDFDTAGATGFFAAIDTLTAGDLVVLVQSTSFRLDAFRIRIELFKRGLATIEHLHLERADDEAQLAIYVDALAYDPAYYRGLGRRLKEKIDAAGHIVVVCDGTTLEYLGGMEPAKLNVGDYEGMTNVGGTFPIGEVFSEPRDLGLVDGEAMIFAFAGTDHIVQIHEPFKVKIEKGILTTNGAPAAFEEVLEQIRGEERVIVREFGLGLNPAMGRHALLRDITAFERQKGLHLSLGEKHGVYRKQGFNQKKNHFHVDVFVDVKRITADGETIFSDGDFLPNGTV